MEIGVQGIHYETATQSGTTDDRGTYKYYPGETITFTIGDLVLAKDIPAKPYLSPLDFYADSRQALQSPSTDKYGLLSQRPIVDNLSATGQANDVMRFLVSLDQDSTVTNGNPITITQRTIDQINSCISGSSNCVEPFKSDIDSYLNSHPNVSTIDYSTLNNQGFINDLVESICFYPAGDYRCAPIKTVDPSWPTAEQQKQRDINNSHRKLSNITADGAKTLLQTDTQNYDNSVAVNYYLSPDAIDLPASNKQIQSVKVLKSAGTPDLVSLQAISQNSDAVAIQSYSSQTNSFQYFVTNQGQAGDVATLIVDFKPAGDYRWYEKTLRVVLK